MPVIEEVINWSTDDKQNKSFHPVGPQGRTAARTSYSFQEMQAAIARWRDSLGGNSPLTTKGDLFTFSTVDARLPVGTNGQILSANAGEATGLLWIDAPAGTIGGSITDNQIAVGAATANEIEGSANFTWEGASGGLSLVGIQNDAMLIQNDDLPTDSYIKWYTSWQAAGRQRWRLGFDADASFRLQTSNDADNSHQNVISASSNASNEVIGTDIHGNAIRLRNGGGTGTDITMSDFNRIIGPAQFTRNSSTSSLYISGGSSTTLGASIQMYGSSGSLANDMYFRGTNNDLWMFWDGSLGRLRISTGATGTKNTHVDFNPTNLETHLYGELSIDSAAPLFRMDENDGALDQKIWMLGAETESLYGRIWDDAELNSYEWLTLQRSGTGAGVQVDTVAVTAATSITLGSLAFDSTQVPGAGTDNFVLTYDNGTGLISLEAAGGGGALTSPVEVTGTGTGAANTSTIDFNTSAGAGNSQLTIGMTLNGNNLSEIINHESNGQVLIGTDNLSATNGLLAQVAGVTVLTTGTQEVRVHSEVDLVFEEKADHTSTPIASRGYVWLRNDAPNNLIFTDDAGTDFVIGGAGAGAIGGSIADNQVAVGAATANDIEGSVGLTFDSATTTLEIGENGTFNLGNGNERIEWANAGNGSITFYQDSQNTLEISGTNNVIMQWGDLTVGSTAAANAVLTLQSGAVNSSLIEFFHGTTKQSEIRQNLSTGHLEIRTQVAGKEVAVYSGLAAEAMRWDSNQNTLFSGYMAAYPGTPGDGQVLTWVTANSRAEFSAAAGIGGSIADDQIAVGAVTANDIEGSANLTYDGTRLTVTSSVQVSGSVANYRLTETDAALDQKEWQTFTNAGVLTHRILDDVTFLNTYNYMEITRSGVDTAVQVDDIDFTFEGTTTFNLASAGAVRVSGPIPRLDQYDTDAALDQKLFRNAGLSRRILDDAGSNFYAYETITRSGTGAGVQVDTIAFDAATSISIGNFAFDSAQTVGAGQDNFVLTYDNGTGLVSLEAAASGTIGGSITDNQIAVGAATANSIEGASTFSLVSSSLRIPGGIRFTDRGAHIETPTAGFGELWGQASAPNTIMWTDDDGGDWQLNRTFNAPQATTSGSSVVLITGLTRAGINEIIVTLKTVSTTAANARLFLRVGSGGTVVATGYTSSCARILTTSTGTAGSTTGFDITTTSLNAAETASGTIRFTRHDDSTNTWMLDGHLVSSSSGEIFLSSGIIDLTGTALARIELHTSSGTFDVGEAAVQYIG